MRLLPIAISLFALVGASMPLKAEWKALAAEPEIAVAGQLMSVTPLAGWNRSTMRPSNRGERWTRDGLALNELTFFAGVRDGEALYFMPAASDKALPKFRANMLPTEIVELFENSNRMILGSSVFSIGKVEPSSLGMHQGVRFTYSYAAQDEGLTREGEAVAAIVEGRLYLVNFVAPAIHYFGRDIAEIRQLISTLQLRPPKAPAAR
jgi:hypothetical protein